MATDAWMEAQVFYLSPSDIARGANAIVEWEQLCTRLWAEADAAGQEDARTIVRAAIIRLMSSAHWMPGAVAIRPGRLEIRIAIEMDAEGEGIHSRGLRELAHDLNRAKEGLVSLAAELEGDEDAPTP